VLLRDLLTTLDWSNPTPWITRLSVVVDNPWVHKTKTIEQWLASHPCFALLWLPTYCPRANLLERVCEDVYDKYPRNHKQQHLRDLIKDIERHVEEHGPLQYKLFHMYGAPEIMEAVEALAAEKHPKRTA